MAMTLESLLAPVSEDAPAGEDLSYDNDRALLEQAFEVNDDPDAEPVEQNWPSMLKLLEAQFARSKDVWLAVYLCRAGALSGSLETVELGAQTLAGLFEGYWETVHPTLDELGLQGRKSPCDSLTTRAGFLRPLEQVVLLAHPRLGVFTGADLQRFRMEGDEAEGIGMFRAAMADVGAEGLSEAMTRLQAVEDGLRRADKVFTREAAGDVSPNFAPTLGAVGALMESVQEFLPEPDEPEELGSEEAESTTALGADQTGGRGRKSFSGGVASRADVVRALKAVVEYYRKTEPSHPVMFLVQRAEAWVEMDFMALLREIAPGAIDQAEGLLAPPRAEY